jgi:hypothetical protein
MPTYYTVVQYVPDPVADERINIGVIAFGDGRISSRFVKNWGRVQKFGTLKNIGFARDFARRIERASVGQESEAEQGALLRGVARDEITEDALLRMIEESGNLIQFTPAQAAIGTPEELLPNLARLFLRGPVAAPAAFRDRQQAARLAVATARKAVQMRLGMPDVKNIVRSNYTLAGDLVKNLTVDMAVVNAEVQEVAEAVSFETHNMAELDDQVERIIFRLDDIKSAHPRARRDVFVFTPKQDKRGFAEARRRYEDFIVSCEKIDANLIPEYEADSWGLVIADLVESHASLMRQSARG